MKKPVIGYVGLTSHWMDFELLERLGQRWPYQVLMVGPVATQVERRARAIPGLVWVGFVPQPELPAYLRGIDLCVMPHSVNDLNRRANPLKIWEYLATGKSFVSVDLPALHPVREWVDVAQDHNHFIHLVDERLRQPRLDRAKAGQEFAQSRSHRVCQDGAGVMIAAPYGVGVRWQQDPTHARPIIEATFMYFDPAHPSGLYGVYEPPPFTLHQCEVIPAGYDRDINVVLICRKPPAAPAARRTTSRPRRARRS